MNKIYLLVPLCGLLIFGGFYWDFSRKYDAKIAEHKRIAVEKLKEKQLLDDAAKKRAYQEAIDAQARRKKEREEKAKREEAEAQAIEDAKERRSKAFDERNRTREQVDRVKKEVDGVKAEGAKAEDKIKQLQAEVEFLGKYTKQAEANARSYGQLIDKLAAAEKVRAAADAAAKAAAAKAQGK